MKAYDTVSERSDKFCKEMSKVLGMEFVSVANPKDVVAGSDIIVTATTSKKPVFRGDWLDKGTHINAIGAHSGPGVRELDDITIKRSRFIVDSVDVCLKEAGDLIDAISKGVITTSHINAELGDIILVEKRGAIVTKKSLFLNQSAWPSKMRQRQRRRLTLLQKTASEEQFRFNLMHHAIDHEVV